MGPAGTGEDLGTEGDGLAVHVEAGFAEGVPAVEGEGAFACEEAADEDGVCDEGGCEAGGEAVKGGDEGGVGEGVVACGDGECGGVSVFVKFIFCFLLRGGGGWGMFWGGGRACETVEKGKGGGGVGEEGEVVCVCAVCGVV